MPAERRHAAEREQGKSVGDADGISWSPAVGLDHNLQPDHPMPEATTTASHASVNNSALLLQIRTRTLKGTLRDLFDEWYSNRAAHDDDSSAQVNAA